MIRRKHRTLERALTPLRPLPGTEGNAAFTVSTAVLDLLGLGPEKPEQAARLDLGDMLGPIREEGA